MMRIKIREMSPGELCQDVKFPRDLIAPLEKNLLRSLVKDNIDIDVISISCIIDISVTVGVKCQENKSDTP